MLSVESEKKFKREMCIRMEEKVQNGQTLFNFLPKRKYSLLKFGTLIDLLVMI
jgi:hypothetical protein